MLTIHWLTDSGDPEPHIVSSFDFHDRVMAADYAFDLYLSVHGFNRGRVGFAIKDRLGRIVHEWRRDGALAGTTFTVVAESVAVSPKSVTARRAPKRSAKGGFAQVAAALIKPGREDSADKRQDRTRPAPQAESAASLRRFAPAIRLAPAAPKKRRLILKLGSDHYLLAALAMAALFVGSPLYSIYSAVDRLQQGGVAALEGTRGLAADARAGAASALSTDGRLDFRKLFWHLRVVAPTEIDLLTYDTALRADGPRIIFTTRDLLRWQMRGVRGGRGLAVATAAASTS